MKKIFLLLFILLNCISYSKTDIFCFHRFNDERYDSTNISNEKLIEFFNYLKENDYKVIKMEELISYLEKKEEIPDKTVVLSIDDAYKSFYENGIEIFNKFNYPFTLFVNTEAVNRRFGDFMTWDQIKEVSKYGEIASHSYSHPHLVNLTKEDIIKDVKRSIEDLEKKLDIKINYFSYPYGEYTHKTKEIIKTLGFKAIFNQNNGSITKDSDIFDLNRIALTEDSSIKSKFNYKYLNAKWLNEDELIDTKEIESIKIELDEKIKKAEFYLSGYTWERIKAENGIFEINLNKKLKFYRNRAIIRTYDGRYSTKIIIKK